MRFRRTAIVLVGLAIVAIASRPSPSRAGGTPDAGGAVSTSTVAHGLSARDLKLARWLDVLIDLELFENYECLELMSVLEDDHE